jgi:hypothetical protein
MRKSLMLAAFALLVTAVPARAQFCPGVSPWVFDDVLASDPFCGFVTWMAENGVTLGCLVIDAEHRLYCPNSNVSRLQMAAFMKRLGDIRVQAVDTGPGLLGGPILDVGTITLAPTQLLPTSACAGNQIARWNGSAWVCSNDGNSGGTVTSVGSGTGLTGGPVTSSGTLSIASSYQLPQGCTNGQVAKSNGSGAWSCATDASSGGTVTSITAGNGLTGGTITTTGTIAVDPSSATLTGNFFRQGGNAFGATAVLGTTDNHALDLRANNARVMRYQPNAISPNILGGHPSNAASAGVRGATIAGGGVGLGDVDPDFTLELPNQVWSHYGTVGGGFGNVAGSNVADLTVGAFAFVGGGWRSAATGHSAAIVGGSSHNASAFGSFIGGGNANNVGGVYSAIAGGQINATGGYYAFVGAGAVNHASGDSSAVIGGQYNTASGAYSLATGRESEARGNYSMAIGRRAKTFVGASNADGAFVFADSNDFDFATSVDNRFTARATGGAYFVTEINGTGGATEYFYVAPSGDVTSTGEIYAVAFNPTSDRNAKTAFAPVDPDEVLRAVASLPVESWTFRGDPHGARHIGPTAQDFRAAFNVGHDDKSIATVDADGVALAAIQGLNAKVESQAREIAELRRMLDALLAERAVAAR